MNIKVKALEWAEHPSGKPLWRAYAPSIGWYGASAIISPALWWFDGLDETVTHDAADIDAAKAAAQADYERRILFVIEFLPDTREAVEALRSIESAPKDGTDILVYYDHDADPYQDPNNPDRLTDYAAWAECGAFMDGKGWCIAAWKERQWESTDEYGSGYWMPAYWFARQHDDYEVVVNPVAWMPLLSPPSDN